MMNEEFTDEAIAEAVTTGVARLPDGGLLMGMPLGDFDSPDGRTYSEPVSAVTPGATPPRTADRVPMTVGELKEHIVYFTDLGGILGQNLGMGKQVLLRVHGQFFNLSQVAVIVHEGLFTLMLDGETRG
jgi:hypothetical protein